MGQRAKLLSIEINPHLHTLVSRIEDGRLIAHRGDANGLKEILSMYGIDAPEVLISGIPFSTMSHCSGSQILEAISSVLVPGGRFVAYQVSKRVACLYQPILGPGQIEVELFNIPTMRVYRWDKNGKICQFLKTLLVDTTTSIESPYLSNHYFDIHWNRKPEDTTCCEYFRFRTQSGFFGFSAPQKQVLIIVELIIVGLKLK